MTDKTKKPAYTDASSLSEPCTETTTPSRPSEASSSSRPPLAYEAEGPASETYLYVEERVVKKMPKPKKETDPTSRLGRLKAMLKPPAVRAAESAPKVEGKTYRVNEQGEIIETTVKRAGRFQGINVAGGDIRHQAPRAFHR